MERLDDRRHRCTAPSLAPIHQHALTANSDTAPVASTPEQLVGVIEHDLARVRQGAVPRGPIDQPFPGGLLQTADRLAHGGLGAAKLARGPRETPFGGDCGKHAQIFKSHSAFGLY